MKCFLSVFLIVLLLCSSLFAQKEMNGLYFRTLETVSGKAIYNGYLLWQEGRIIVIDNNRNNLEKIKKAYPKVQWRKEVASWIIPGYVLPFSEFGTPRSGQSVASPDGSLKEVFNPYEANYEKMLSYGFTSVCLAPSGTGFVGSGLLLKPGKESTIEKEETIPMLRFQVGERSQIRKMLDSLTKLKEAHFKQSKFKPLFPYFQVFQKKSGMIAEISSPHLTYLFLKDRGPFTPTLLLRGRAYSLKETLKEYPGNLLLEASTHYEPASDFLQISALELAKPGRMIGLLPTQDNLDGFEKFRLDCARLLKFGYTRHEALNGMTLNNAKILGIEKEFGSLEKGKKANFILFSGDPFSLTSKLEKVYLEGEPVN